jgi:hypothetical protein
MTETTERPLRGGDYPASQQEAEEFMAWLRAQGYNPEVMSERVLARAFADWRATKSGGDQSVRSARVMLRRGPMPVGHEPVRGNEPLDAPTDHVIFYSYRLRTSRRGAPRLQRVVLGHDRIESIQVPPHKTAFREE